MIILIRELPVIRDQVVNLSELTWSKDRHVTSIIVPIRLLIISLMYNFRDRISSILNKE